MDEVIEVVAAILVLGAFTGAQINRMDQHKTPYLLLNLVGTGVLAWLAWLDRSWGFLLLEGVWALVSAVALAALYRRRSSARVTAAEG